MKKLSPNGKKLIFAVLLLSCLLSLLAILTTPSLAQTSLVGPGNLGSKSGEVETAKIIGRFISVFVLTAGAFALLMFFYGGIVWITSMGNTANIQKGKGILVWATLGLIVIIFARVITDFLIFALIYKIEPVQPAAPPPPPAAVNTCAGTCYETADCVAYGNTLDPKQNLKASASGNCAGSVQANTGKSFSCCDTLPPDPTGCLGAATDPTKTIEKDGNGCCSTNPAYFGGQTFTGITPATICRAATSKNMYRCCDCGLSYESNGFSCQDIGNTCNPIKQITVYRGTTTQKLNYEECTSSGNKFIRVQGHCGTNANIFCSYKVTDYNEINNLPQFKAPATP